MTTRISLPQGMAYGWWHFSQPLFDDLVFEVEFGAGDERIPGRYYQLYQGQIGGVGMYLGFQTDLFRPGLGGQGKGLLFSRWGSRSDDDASPTSGGWIENAGHEDDFVGVRSLFNWGLGRYRCWLRPIREDQVGRWYEFGVRCPADGQEATAGSLWFPNPPEQKAMIHSGGSSWTEVYTNADFVEDVPLTRVVVHNIAACGGSLRPIRCDTQYNPKFPCADCFVSSDGALHLESGRGVTPRHPQESYKIT
jgi:hypothetical protein